MAYVIEPWDGLELDLSDGPYTVPSPLAIELEFVWFSYPPLPWVTPSIKVEYSAPISTASAAHGINRLWLTAAETADDIRTINWGDGAGANWNPRIKLTAAEVADKNISSLFNAGNAVSTNVRITWQSSGAADNSRQMVWQGAVVKDRHGYVSAWIMNSRFVDRNQPLNWFSVNVSGSLYDDTAALLATLNTDSPIAVNLEVNAPSIWNQNPSRIRLEFGYIKPRRPSVPHDITKRITARKAAARDNRRLIPWGVGSSIWKDWNLPYPVDSGPPIPPDPVDPPIRKIVYITMNTLSVVDTETNSPLDIQNVNISLDIDSFSWKFSGTVFGQATLDLIKPDSEGMKDIRVTINSHEWIFSIESYTSDEKFPTQKFNVSGISRTQYMAAPYAPIGSFTNSSAMTAAQACEAVLTDTGFTLDWPTGDDEDLPDWTLLTGSLSYRDKSPAQVIAQIVSAAGGVMIPAMASDSWTIQPRYKTSPWHWETLTPDAAIYIGMVRSRSAKYEPGQAYDACYVSGINQGVAVDVQLTGSGGLNPMPDIFDDLITATAPAICRGRNELAAAGNKVVETLSVIIPESGAAPGILVPGMIVAVTHDEPVKDYIALVLANSISVQRAGAAEIYQNVTLERSV